MRGMTKLAMGATLVLASSLALLLALLLFLLISFFFSLLRNKTKKSKEFSGDPLEQMQSPRPLSFPFYGHGVLKAPTEYLLSMPNISISNPVYEEAEAQATSSNANANANGGNTPFVSLKASPLHLEIDVDEECNESSPPLKEMKKLPSVLPKAYTSVCLFEGRRSLGASTETNRPSSSSSDSLCSSPSW